jgi:hypothetical protein
VFVTMWLILGSLTDRYGTPEIFCLFFGLLNYQVNCRNGSSSSSDTAHAIGTPGALLMLWIRGLHKVGSLLLSGIPSRNREENRTVINTVTGGNNYVSVRAR